MAAFSSYVLSLAPKISFKKCAYNVDEIDGRCLSGTGGNAIKILS